MSKKKLELVSGWSCDERNRSGCRNPHGCHCREITSLLERVPALPQCAQEPVAWQYRVMFDKGHVREDEWCDWSDAGKRYFDKVNADIAAGAKRIETRALYAAPQHPQGVREALADLTCEFTQMLPGGKLDDSTYEKIETALDRIDAPITSADGKWLSLHERIAALSEGKPGGDDSEQANWARLGASEYAGYRWPEDTAEHRAMRAAFMDGAAHAVTRPNRGGPNG